MTDYNDAFVPSSFTARHPRTLKHDKNLVMCVVS